LNRATEFRRKSVIKLCNTVIGRERLDLNLSSICTSSNKKTLSLKFLENEKEINLCFVSSSSPLPAFNALSDFYLERFSSLANLHLSFYRYRPPGISSSRPRAHVEVCTPHSCGVFVGPPSVERDSYLCALLGCFEFFINCELTFTSLLKVLKNAKSRNRQDIYQKACFNLSELTSLNSYEILKEKP
jgi:hypothetical protein